MADHGIEDCPSSFTREPLKMVWHLAADRLAGERGVVVHTMRCAAICSKASFLGRGPGAALCSGATPGKTSNRFLAAAR
jgi:hypothetical protein